MKRLIMPLALMPMLTACASEPSVSDIESAFTARSGSIVSIDKHGCDQVSDKTYQCVMTVYVGGQTLNQTRTLMNTGNGWRLTD